MSPPLPPGKLPSLEKPAWLTTLITAYRHDPVAIQKFTNQYLAQVNIERMAGLAELSNQTASERAKVVEAAMKQKGSKLWLEYVPWAFDGPRGSEVYGAGSSKCNLFVFEMMARAGVSVPMELGINGSPVSSSRTHPSRISGPTHGSPSPASSC